LENNVVKLQTYRESNLFGKYDTEYPDSIWYDGLSFKINYPIFGLSEEMIPSDGQNTDIIIDSLINSLKNDSKLFLKESSSFYSALDSIKLSDSLIIKYLVASRQLVRFPKQA